MFCSLNWSDSLIAGKSHWLLLILIEDGPKQPGVFVFKPWHILLHGTCITVLVNLVNCFSFFPIICLLQVNLLLSSLQTVVVIVSWSHMRIDRNRPIQLRFPNADRADSLPIGSMTCVSSNFSHGYLSCLRLMFPVEDCLFDWSYIYIIYMPLKSMTGNDCLVVSHSFTVFLVYYMLPFFGGLSNHWFDHGSAITGGFATPFLRVICADVSIQIPPKFGW